MGDRVTRAEFARRQGVARSTVTRWIESGRISVGSDGLIDVERGGRERAATESPMPHHQARKAQIDAQKAQPAPADVSTDQPVEPLTGYSAPEQVGVALKLETYKLQRAKAELAAIEVDKMAGALVERQEVDFVLADFGITLRRLIEGLPARLTGQIAGCRGDSAAIHKTLADAAHDLLTEMADHMARKGLKP